MNRTEDVRPLHGMRILIADDEFLIAISIEETLRNAGAEIVSAATLPAALKRASDEPLSAALLDVHLGRQTTGAVAQILAARGVPFIFYTGHTLPESLQREHPAAPVLIKPVNQDTFVDAFRTFADRRPE